MASQMVRGLVIDAASQHPLAGLRVEAHQPDHDADPPLGTAATDADGSFTIQLDERRATVLTEQQPYIFFRVFQGDRLLVDTRKQVLWSLRNPNMRVVITVRSDLQSAPPAFQIAGVVTTAAGVAVPDLRVEAWDEQLGGEALLAAGITDAGGHYALAYDAAGLAGKTRADLTVRVLDPRANDAEIARSPLFYQADPQVTLPLIVDAVKVSRPSEYAQLLSAMVPVLGRTDVSQLDAKGVEYVANRVRWDARLVAMAAQAAKLSASTHIPAEHYYALMRTGVSGDADALHRLSAATAESGLKRAMDGGVISTDQPVDKTLELLRAQSVAALRNFAPATAVSSLTAMLGVSLDAAATTQFLDAYHTTADNPATLWSTLARSGFPAPTIARLQTDGKLGFLTRQNAPLVTRLRTQAKIGTAEDLVGAGLYRASAWTDLIGHDTPAQISASSYAQGLAAQVSLSYPTLVTADLVRRGELPIDASPAGAEGEVARFLRTGHPTYTIGIDRVKQWADYAKLTPQGQAGARLVERLYQLTPSDESMLALHKIGLHAAADIVRVPRSVFLRKFGSTFPSQTEAAKVYQKAQEIHTTTLSLATMFLSYQGSPNVYVMTGKGAKQLPSWPASTPGTPMLQDLLDNMDYCSCDECKSVLGAAAYFVELLQFIDFPDVTVGQNPQAVLLARRPDLQDLLLSCENTNIALPYIDLVNEVLEHFIVHGDLRAFHGYNMREDSLTADLLADPEYVTDAAYDKTRAEVYPHSLPFDMPLAALRLLMQGWNTTLADALALLGTAAAARREGMGLSAAEYSILTDVGFRALPEYFGEAAAATIDALNSAVAEGAIFCQRTEITYVNLVDILGTRFINPGAPLMPLLTPLQISLAQLQSFYTGGLTDAALQALLPPTLDPADYGGDILAWLQGNRAVIMGLITLTDMSPTAMPCSFATVELRFALPDSGANRLTNLAYQKLHRFIRLWMKLGWSITFTDQVVTTFLGLPPENLNDGNLDATCVALVARIGNFLGLQRRLSLSDTRLADWLPVWDTTQPLAARQDTLAHLLRLGATDLVHLAEITGADPLADDMANDAPSLFGFLDARKTLAAIGLKVVDIDYLLRHRDDGGKLVPTDASLLRDLKALRDATTAVATDLGAPPANADLGYARSKMALVYDAAVVDRFLGLVSGSAAYTTTLNTVEETLPVKLTAVSSRLGYDPFAKQLTYVGVLAPATATAIAAAADTLVLADVSVIVVQADLTAYIAALKPAILALRDAGQAELQAFGLDYPELKSVYDAIAPIADPAAQALALVNQVIPTLLTRLQAIALRTALSASLKVDPDVIDAMTAGPAMLHADGNAGVGVLADFLGLSAAAPLNANQTYALHLDPPSTDDYILYVAAPPGTVVSLAIDGAMVIPSTTLGARGEVETATVVSLQAGALSAAVLTMASLPPGGGAELRWRTKGLAKTAVPPERTYLDTGLDAARASLLRLQKTALLLHAIPFTAHELTHLASVNTDTAGVLNALDVTGSILPGDLHVQWGRLAWLAWFWQRKADEPEPDTWVGLLENPGQVTPKGALVFAAAAGWTDADLIAVLGHFGTAITGLSALHMFRRVKETLDLVAATGLTAANLLAWTVEAPNAALIAAIKHNLRTTQDALSWQSTLQSVNDALRNLRRDALVWYILHHQSPGPGIDTADKLYEHFLIDVSMDACMLTSRIRQGLSTVQLFITRCLMNLESGVDPSSIRADQWPWMRRYRLWQANREIFLYPENWLEPELRDNKSPFFSELESDLLKSDITDELAEDAYLSYLKKLDEVAHLEILCSYLQESQFGNPDDDILHVFGRTNGNTHQYYYRRHEGGYWTPWVKMTLNIEGDILIPVIWKTQLYVFWLSMVHKPQGADSTQTPAGMSSAAWGPSAKVTAEINLLWGEYYQGKWTSPKSSELKQPIRLTDLDAFEPDKIVVTVRTETPSPDISERLVMTLRYLGSPWRAFTAVFTSKNAPPSIANSADLGLFLSVELFDYELLWAPQPSALTSANALREPGKTFKVRVSQPSGALTSTRDETLLTKAPLLADGFSVRALMHPTANQWEAPLFYSDERSIFFIDPTERIVSVAHYNGFYWNEVAAVAGLADRVPPLYQQPIIKDPRGPVENPLLSAINPNYDRVISDNTQFIFGGAAFNAGGVASQAASRITSQGFAP